MCPLIKAAHKVPSNLAACHTAIVNGYVVEGHVPEDVIRKMLAEKPKISGIAVAGMPMGAPGMETEGVPQTLRRDGVRRDGHVARLRQEIAGRPCGASPSASPRSR